MTRQIVKFAADRVDIDERQIVVVRAVCEQNKDAFLNRIDPEARACKASMPKAFGRHSAAGG